VIDSSPVRAALDTVRDPELDTSIVELGFVSACTVDDDGRARVRLRLPTFFCAPNFAFLMVADAYDAVSRVDGVAVVDIVLEDHFAAEEINMGVAARAGFVASFGGLAEHELDDLRREFLCKAMLAAQDRVLRPLLAAGVALDDLGALRLGDVPHSADRDRLRARRVELGIPSGDTDPLLVHVDGSKVAHGDVPLHVRRSRTVRVSIDANGDYCRQLLRERYARSAHDVAPGC
jgi:metal-sulfur cluster biosynthetic enzyme